MGDSAYRFKQFYFLPRLSNTTHAAVPMNAAVPSNPIRASATSVFEKPALDFVGNHFWSDLAH
jgi:hypothetical protein